MQVGKMPNPQSNSPAKLSNKIIRIILEILWLSRYFDSESADAPSHCPTTDESVVKIIGIILAKVWPVFMAVEDAETNESDLARLNSLSPGIEKLNQLDTQSCCDPLDRVDRRIARSSFQLANERLLDLGFVR